MEDAIKRAKKAVSDYSKASAAQALAHEAVCKSCQELIKALTPSMSGAEIAKRVGVSRSYVSLIRNGFRKIGISTLDKLIALATKES